jgi:hypothetical protein
MREITGGDEMAFRRAPGPVSRLIALAAALAGEEAEALRALPLPEWEGRLIDLHAHVLGPRLRAEVDCPACGGGVALDFPVGDLPREASAGPALRAGDIADLEATGLSGDAATAFLRAGAGADPVTEEALEAMVGGLDIDIACDCAECGAAIVLPLDVASFLDTALCARASRLLDEVHLIASHYHWAEAEILALPFPRRQDYVARILSERSLAGRPVAARILGPAA